MLRLNRTVVASESECSWVEGPSVGGRERVTGIAVRLLVLVVYDSKRTQAKSTKGGGAQGSFKCMLPEPSPAGIPRMHRSLQPPATCRSLDMAVIFGGWSCRQPWPGCARLQTPEGKQVCGTNHTARAVGKLSVRETLYWCCQLCIRQVQGFWPRTSLTARLLDVK